MMSPVLRPSLKEATYFTPWNGPSGLHAFTIYLQGHGRKQDTSRIRQGRMILPGHRVPYAVFSEAGGFLLGLGDTDQGYPDETLLHLSIDEWTYVHLYAQTSPTEITHWLLTPEDFQ